MAAIITATDFSDVAANAAHYACQLAMDRNMEVIVLHSYTVPVAFHENPMPVIPMEESKQIAESQMEEFMEELFKSYPQLAISSNVTYGDITDILKENITEYNPWVVVVGNSISEDEGFWLGSNLLSTLRNLSCPVLAIPAGYQYKKVQKICFACDYEKVADRLPANNLVSMANTVGASLHVLNVDHDNKRFDTDTPLETTQLHEMLKAAHPQYYYMDNQDIDEGIQEFVKEKEMDWLVVIPHRHNFFESLFHKSQTKAIVRHAHVPILALHDRKD